MNTPTTVLASGTPVPASESDPELETLLVPPFQIPPGFHAFIAIHFIGLKRKQVTCAAITEPGVKHVANSCSDGSKVSFIISNFNPTQPLPIQITGEIDSNLCSQPIGYMGPATFDGFRVTTPIGTSTAQYYAFTGPEPEMPDKIGIVIILQEGVELNDPLKPLH